MIENNIIEEHDGVQCERCQRHKTCGCYSQCRLWIKKMAVSQVHYHGWRSDFYLYPARNRSNRKIGQGSECHVRKMKSQCSISYFYRLFPAVKITEISLNVQVSAGTK